MSKKTILMSDGNTDYRLETKAKTEKGYIQFARKNWIYANPIRLSIKVFDPNSPVHPYPIFETTIG